MKEQKGLPLIWSFAEVRVLKEKNTNDKLPEDSPPLNKINCISPTFSFSQSLKKLSRPFKVPTFIRQVENSKDGKHPQLGTWHKPLTVAKPVHDPKAENAIILYDPADDIDHSQENIKKKDRSVAEILEAKNEANKKVPVIVGTMILIYS